MQEETEVLVENLRGPLTDPEFVKRGGTIARSKI